MLSPWWLSLLPSIDRILKYWNAPNSYIQSEGEGECARIVWRCFGEERNEVSETYFLFLSHVLKVFSDTIDALEAKSFSITSVFKVMTELKQKLERRMKDRFFGLTVNTKLKQLASQKNVRPIFCFFMKEQRNTSVKDMTSLTQAFIAKWPSLASQLLCHLKTTVLLYRLAIWTLMWMDCMRNMPWWKVPSVHQKGKVATVRNDI